MRRNNTYRNGSVDVENPYWMSFADLMSALLVIFILAAVMLIIELTEKTQNINADIQDLKNAEQARHDILHEVKDKLEARYNVKVEIAENDTVIRIPENTLTFARGKANIPQNDKVQEAVRNIGEVLQQAIIKNDRFQYLDTVFIEGHTDSRNIYYKGKGNWGLSADRAIHVWQIWQDDLTVTPKLGNLKNSNNQKLFSVSGYAATRRIQEIEDTPNQRARNRRLDIRFTVKKPTITDLEKIVEQ